MMRLMLLSACVGLGLPMTSLAFGAAGHEAVCEIAYLELSGPVRARVDAILAAETDAAFRTFRQACNWPDSDGREQQRRRSEHYINIPRHWTSLFYEECYQTSNCLFTAIYKDLSIVANRGAGRGERLRALKFLGHWVGDIHQPLHVSYADDRGGNEILVEPGLGCAKLHAVWDRCIPDDIMSELGVGTDRKAFAAKLRASVTPAERAAWTSDLSALKWANESYAIARRQDVEYCQLDGTVCKYTEEDREFFPAEDLENEGRIEINLPQAYEDSFNDEVSQRLKQAGVRLGALLNQALSD
jgi:hypothetical protein